MPEALKHKYNKAYIAHLANSVYTHHKGFNKKAFSKAIFDKDWKNKELKTRMVHISTQLRVFLPDDYKEAAKILIQIAPEFGGFEGMFIPHFIESYGLNHWHFSIKALESITEYASAEFAIRQFIQKDKERAMSQMLKWSKHKNHHVRRLSSEGCRPRLPWACSLPEFKNDPRLIFPILDNLKTDESLYVRRSVANNINDISKDNPEIALDLIRLWKGSHKHSDWILKHGARTLLKQPNKQALYLFGMTPPKHIEILDFNCDSSVAIGDNLAFQFLLSSTQRLGTLRIEYKIDFVKASGKYGRKIFKIGEGNYQDKQKTFKKSHSFKQLSTRFHHPGKHHLSIIINGLVFQQYDFIVK